MIKNNFHTHTIYCDGKNSIDDIVETAIKKGFTDIGFSGHVFSENEKDYCMSLENTKKYIDEINNAKIKYKNKINVFLGIEKDYFSNYNTEKFDYVIGSVHYIKKNNIYLPVDESAKITLNNINNYYSGSFDRYAEDYFLLVTNIVNKTKCNIIGHFDIVTKFNTLININLTERYYKFAENAIKELVKNNIIFEINTGAMAKGIKLIPYPDFKILKLIKKYDGKIMFSSDCHNKDYLDYKFDYAEDYARKAGFKEYYVITSDGKKSKRL